MSLAGVSTRMSFAESHQVQKKQRCVLGRAGSSLKKDNKISASISSLKVVSRAARFILVPILRDGSRI